MKKRHYTLFYIYIAGMLLGAWAVDAWTKSKIDNIEYDKITTVTVEHELSWQKKQDVAKYILANAPIDPTEALGIAATIVDAAEKYNIDYRILNAIIQTESNYNEMAVGKINRSDKGIAQVNTFWNEQELVKAGIIKSGKDLMKLEPCTYAGAFLFAKYIQEKDGNTYQAIKRYNGQNGNDYLFKVIENYNNFLSMR